MPEFDRLTDASDWMELEFVEREATPESLMKLSIHLHAAGLSLPDAVSVLENSGVERCRSTLHNWVQNVDLQPTDGKNPNHVAVDETVIQLNDQRYWLYAAVDPEPNEFHHVKLSPTRCFSSMVRRGYRPHSSSNTSDFTMSHTEIGIASNVSPKK